MHKGQSRGADRHASVSRRSQWSESSPVSVEHYENFPVASVLCPPALRPVVTAIYHFARTADDIADEGDGGSTERLADLRDYREDLEAVYCGRAPSPRWAGVFSTLARGVVEFNLPHGLLADLLDAFEQDVRNPLYANRTELLDYCRRSANPIGRLLLHLYGINDTRSLLQADAICSALQLINFWQDLSVDGPRHRLYVPVEDSQRHGVARGALEGCEDSPAARRMIGELCDWARGMILSGAPLCLSVPGRAGWELRLVVQGGLRILEKIAQMDHAALNRRPALAPQDGPLLLWRAVWMRMTPESAR